MKLILRLSEGKRMSVAAARWALTVMLAICLVTGVAISFATAADKNVGQDSRPADEGRRIHENSDAKPEPVRRLTARNNKGMAKGLVLWNTFDSKRDIYNSRVGAGAVYRGEGGTFVEGVAGNALELNYDVYEAIAFPKEVVPVDAGCIEFWARMNNFPEMLQAGQRPCLIQAADGKHTYGIHFNGNDGFGDGGLCGWAGEGGHCGTGEFGNWSYESILGKGQVDAWHHFALVWDKAGLTGEAKGKKFAVFLDGRLNTGRWRDGGQTIFEPLTGGELKLHIKHDSLGQGTIAYDQLKIWDYAKTNFGHVTKAIRRMRYP